MKAVKIAAVVAGLLVVALLAYAALLVRSLDTPEFKKSVLDRARAALGTDVEVREMSVSLLSGVSLRGVTILNPSGFSGHLLTADAFVLRYRVMPLLRGRLEVERLVLERPVLSLASNAKGAWNYEKLGGGAASEKEPASAPGSAVTLAVSRLAVEDAEIVILGEKAAPLVKVEDADLSSSFEASGGAAHGSGRAAVGTLRLAESLFVRRIASPLDITRDRLTLAPIRGKLAEGDLTGELTLRLRPALRYALSLEVKGAQVQKLLQEAGSARAFTGTLAGKASFEGSGGLVTMTGKGRAEITGCKATGAPVMAALAEALRLPELKNPSFDECLLEFTLAGGRLQTPVVRMTSPDIRLAGKGVANLVSDALDYDMTLALRQAMLDRIPVREMRAAFQPRPDGFSAVDFELKGTMAAPQTDLTAKIGAAAATELVKGGLGKLFERKKK